MKRRQASATDQATVEQASQQEGTNPAAPAEEGQAPSAQDTQETPTSGASDAPTPPASGDEGAAPEGDASGEVSRETPSTVLFDGPTDPQAGSENAADAEADAAPPATSEAPAEEASQGVEPADAEGEPQEQDAPGEQSSGTPAPASAEAADTPQASEPPLAGDDGATSGAESPEDLTLGPVVWGTPADETAPVVVLGQRNANTVAEIIATLPQGERTRLLGLIGATGGVPAGDAGDEAATADPSLDPLVGTDTTPAPDLHYPADIMVVTCSKPGGCRRGGRAWAHGRTEVSVHALSWEQWGEVRRDPRFTVFDPLA